VLVFSTIGDAPSNRGDHAFVLCPNVQMRCRKKHLTVRARPSFGDKVAQLLVKRTDPVCGDSF